MRRNSIRGSRLPGLSGWALALTFTACADATSVDRADPDAHTIRPVPAPDARGPGVEDAFIPRDAWEGRADAFVPGPDAAPPQPDAALPDAAVPDAAVPDAAVPDAMAPDGPPPDAAPLPDACVAGVEVCNGVDDDCDGEIDEGLPLQWPDMDGDGYGSPSGLPTCVEGLGRVPDGSDCDDDDPGVNPNMADAPDADFADTNCDGVDGTRRAMLFVDVNTGTPPEMRDGTPERPFGALSDAFAAAAMDARITDVAIAAGRYVEPVFLVDGLSIHGGYDPGRSWARSRRLVTLFSHGVPDRGRVVALSAAGIRQPTTVDLLSFEAAGDPGPGGSIYAIHAAGAPGLVLREVTATAGPAPAGIDGVDGVNGADGQPGQSGGDCGRPAGAGGASTCGATGGAGGAGAGRGGDGAPGEFPGCGGAGGPRGNGGAGGDGAHGCNPDPLVAGVDGAPGAGGTLDAQRFWTTAPGGDGQHGPNGPPGGGGGGGGGAAVIDGTAGSGAGGGAGGCGGQAGTGGTGGGGSFALFVVESTGLRVEGCTFTSGDAGGGGRGGVGGAPGQGADGGTGGRGREAFSCGGLAGPGWGGDGGRGAAGARGGNGGGGAGGPSAAIYCVDTQVVPDGATFLQPGLGGTGGAGPTNRGVNGVSAGTVGCE